MTPGSSRSLSRWWKPGRVPEDEGEGVLEFAVLSALMLFWEVCLIRWVSTEIRVFAYYKNLTLLAAFLGFGIGLLTCDRQADWLRSCLLRLGALVAAVVLYPISPVRIEEAPAFFEEFTWHPQLASVWVAVKFYGIILGIFVLVGFAFVPWGRRIGYYFERLCPIPAYSINVASNLAGIGAFSVMSVLGAPPIVWVLAGVAPLAILRLRLERPALAVAAGAAVPILLTGAQFFFEHARTFWSPYYKITIVPPGAPPAGEPFAILKVNHDYHQRLLDLRPEHVRAQPRRYQDWAVSYNLPYVVGRAGRVLAIGAGTGNDVAAALRHGASYVAAVEIDPVIQRIGEHLHPERPYDSDRVEVFIQDARTFLAKPPSPRPFDVVVFGLLDSHTQVSGMNSLRLDNFVYTTESFRQAAALLEPNGGLLSVSFSQAWGDSGWTVRRIHRMLSEAFDSAPRALFSGYDSGITFLAGPAARAHPFFGSPTARQMHAEARRQAQLDLAAAEVPATDDWPFLYLSRRAIPTEYWILIGLVTLVAAAWLRGVTGGSVLSLPWHFFFLGGAFLLVEVKNLVELSLLFGSTWQVNSLAIGAILVMILLANLVAHRFPRLDVRALYAILFAALVLGAAVRPADFQHAGRLAQSVLVPLYLSLPIFAAGLVFIRSFARAANPAAALGANILGGIFGGLLEYASLALGIHALQYLAIGMYALSYAALRRRGAIREEEGARAPAEPLPLAGEGVV
jgi:spermidine synthase